jgi:hypothetical protein
MLRLLIIMCSVFLASCSFLPNFTATNPLINKEMQLESPRFLSQTRYISWISWSQDVDINTIEWPSEQKGCVSHADNCVPTLSEYLTNPEPWQTWKMDSNGSQYRILGILPKGTQYHFYRIDDAENINTGMAVFYAIIDSGHFKFIPAYYKYDTSHITKSLREQSQ